MSYRRLGGIPSSDIGETACRKVVINARHAAVTSEHLLKCSSCEEPLVLRQAADTARVSEVLIGTSAVAIEGNCEAVYAQFGHELPFMKRFIAFREAGLHME